MAGSKKKSGGIKGLLGSLFGLIIAFGLVFAWAGANNIDSIDSAFKHFQAKSHTASACTKAGKSWFECYFTDVSISVPKPKDLPGLPKIDTSKLPKIDTIKTGKAEDVDYSRKEWKHWVKDSNGCTTRDNVLASQGKNIKKKGTCKVISGEWIDPYTGDTVTDPKKLDIDHVAPLAYVAAHGGNSWDAATKQKFANDYSHLLAVSAGENRSKGAKGPSEYMPPDETYHCQYAQVWMKMASSYGFTIDKADKAEITKALKTCS